MLSKFYNISLLSLHSYLLSFSFILSKVFSKGVFSRLLACLLFRFSTLVQSESSSVEDDLSLSPDREHENFFTRSGVWSLGGRTGVGVWRGALKPSSSGGLSLLGGVEASLEGRGALAGGPG